MMYYVTNEIIDAILLFCKFFHFQVYPKVRLIMFCVDLLSVEKRLKLW